ncbi:hypothetical protein [Spiroplasma poulsonii]|uniref:hypothetical protein n=1 Tax=Spiroplasma poulsonii TaxID=2138 RepID=UPI001F4CA0E6|nr:hypothetical protein [Spiroplasma poulsonii]UNF62702.1 hypothetical protein MNU24_08325 [Spiroplasma poulsonii]
MLFRKQKQDNLTVIKSKKPILKQGLERFIAYYFKKIFTILAISMITFVNYYCIVIAILSAILWFLPNTETSTISKHFSNNLNKLETLEKLAGQT